MAQQGNGEASCHSGSKPTLLLRDIKLLVTMDEGLGDISDAAVYCTGNLVTWVGPSSSLPAEYQRADTVLSLPLHLVHPGLINTHHHMYQHLTRAVAPDSELFGWLTSLYLPWNAMTAADVAAATKLACAELILSGCTTSSDHLYVFPNDVTLDVTIKAAAELGLRFHPTRGAMSRGKSQGGMPPDSCVETEPGILSDMERVIRAYHDAGHGSMCRVGLAPCSPFSVTSSLMKSAADLARRYPKVRLHTHLAENREDIKFSLETYGCRPGEYLRQVGWWGDDVWCAHCVKLDEEEMRNFAGQGIGVSHCPSSNLRLASGICPVRQLLDTGVITGLGVDGSASNDGSNVISEARMALLLQRHSGNVAGLSVREAMKVATLGGAACLGRSEDVGRIAPGYVADMVGWKTDGIAFAGAQHNLLGGLLLGAFSLGPVDLSIINGKQVVAGGVLLTADLQQLIADVNQRSERLCHLVPEEHKVSK